jgi:hypothetical protein
MTDDQILEVVAARKAGKQIQERHLDQEDWHNMRVPHGMWHFSMYEYRVAPEPREYAILNYNDKTDVWNWEQYNRYIHSGNECAHQLKPNEVIRVREVLP